MIATTRTNLTKWRPWRKIEGDEDTEKAAPGHRAGSRADAACRTPAQAVGRKEQVARIRSAPVNSASVTDHPLPHLSTLSTLLLALAGAAGYVDAVGFLAFEHVFVANMTGNSVLLGIAAVEGHTDATLRSLLALAGFMVGATIGTTITDTRKAAGLWPAPVTAAIAIESVVLVTVAVAWAAVPHGTGALGGFVLGTAIAMGLQSAAARKLAVAGVSTVVLTSTLTSLVARAVAHIHHRKWSDPTPKDPTKGPGILFGVWFAYVIGAGLGAWLARVHPRLVIAVPAALVLLVMFVAQHTFHRGEARE